MFDVGLPITSKDREGGQVVKMEVTKDGEKFVTWKISYHSMSDEVFADLGAVVHSFFNRVKRVGLSPKEFSSWEDQFADLIKNYRDSGHGTGAPGTGTGAPTTPGQLYAAPPPGYLSVEQTLVLLNGLAVLLKPSTIEGLKAIKAKLDSNDAAMAEALKPTT